MLAGGRYVPAVLFGCVPVFWQLDEHHQTQKPFQELPDVDWDACSLNVTAATMPQLHATLSAVPSEQVRSSTSIYVLMLCFACRTSAQHVRHC